MLLWMSNVQIGTIHLKPSTPESSLCRARTNTDNPFQEELNTLQSQIPANYHEFLDKFSKSKADKLPDHNPQFNHHIDIEEGSTPPFRPVYSTSEAEAATLHNFLKENLDCGFICQSQSLCSTPVLFAKKKDGTLHLCVNWCGLNAITQKDHYLLPLIPNLMDHLYDSWIFTKINLCGTYNLVHIAPGDKWKTAFCTHYGSFNFLVMHFRLTNTPATFWRFMNSIFSDVLDRFVVVYLDNILIFSRNPEEHKENVQEVLCCLQKHHL